MQQCDIPSTRRSKAAAFRLEEVRTHWQAHVFSKGFEVMAFRFRRSA